METRKFEIGDVVRIRSGGPKMTIEMVIERSDHIKYKCAWIESKEGKMGITYSNKHTEMFYEAMLEFADETT